MSRIKDFNPAMYESNFEAIKTFIKEGHSDQYDFNVCTKRAAENALMYLCVNDIQHTYHVVSACGLYCTTISWADETGNCAYCFWCEGEI